MPFREHPLSLAGKTAAAGEATALDGILSLIWLLLCVLVIIALAYLFTKYVVGRGGLGGVGLGGRSEHFQVLARLSLGREQGAALVKAGELYLLLGVAPSGITLLKELTREEAEAICPPPDPERPAPPSFGEALRTAFKQKKPR